MGNLSSGLKRSLPVLYMKSGRVVSCNNRFSELTGLTCEDVLDKSVADIFHCTLKSTLHLSERKPNLKEDEFFFFLKDGSAKKARLTIISERKSNVEILSFVEVNITYHQNIYCFLEHIYANSDVGFAIFSGEELILLKANEVLLSYMEGYYTNPEDCIGDSLQEFFRHLGSNSFEQIVHQFGNIDETRHINEFMFDLPTRGITYWDLKVAPIQDDFCNIFFIVVIKEVTEEVLNRMRLEKQAKTIQDKNQQLQAIFDNVSDGLYIEDYDNDNTTILINKNASDFLESLGIPHDNPGMIKEMTFLDGDGKPYPKERLPLTRIKSGETYEQSLYTLKHMGKEFHLSISGTQLHHVNGKLEMALLCVQNVTDRVNKEKELQRQRDLYYNIFDTLGLPVVYLSYPDLEVRGMNRSACCILKELDGVIQLETEVSQLKTDNHFFIKKISMPDIDKEKFRTHLSRIESTREIEFCTMELLKKGKKNVYKLILQPVINFQNKIDEMIITGIDITHETEEKEVAENLSKMKDELVYTITHEFKTPLTVIHSAIQAMEHLCRDEMTDKIQRYIQKIKQNAFRQLRLVNNLLDINKLSIGKMKLNICNMDIVDATRSITESVQIYAQHKGVELLFSTSTDKRIIGIDDDKYERILLNLLSNAIKFTPKGKSVYVHVSLKRRNKRLMACIEVADEGIGIPQDKFALIFERFGQVDSSLARNAEGSGLGLALVKQIVEALNGEIEVTSKLGVGTTFTVYLPASKAHQKPMKVNMQPLIKEQLIHTTAIEFFDIYQMP